MDDITRGQRTNQRRTVELPNAALQLPQWQQHLATTTCFALIQSTGGVKLVLKSQSSVFYTDVTQYMLKGPQNAVNCSHLVALNFSLDI